jgi:hypothetical protein
MPVNNNLQKIPDIFLGGIQVVYKAVAQAGVVAKYVK